jgi:hypothetical protein
MTQITQIYTKKNICVNLRDLRESFSGFSAGKGLDSRNDIPCAGIEHRASSIEHRAPLRFER